MLTNIFSSQIIPAFVREAYSLLRQSIIHVEQDDIDFDEEDAQLNGGPPGGGGGGGGPNGNLLDDDEEVLNLLDDGEELTQAELDALAKAESSLGNNMGSSSVVGGRLDSNQDSMLAQAGSLPRGSRTTASASGGLVSSAGAGPSTSSVRASSRQPASTPPPPAVAQPPKRKLKITYDQYVGIQTLILLHLAEIERNTGNGMNRDDLIDWYLEQKENDIHTTEELEYETELIGKVLGRLVKVCSSLRPCWYLILFLIFVACAG